jgi:MFS superfamily sulfate permease-like transporter
LATILISFVTCLLLYLAKKFINERYKKKLPAPLPFELLVVVIGTVASYAFDFGKKSQVAVVGPLEKGFPMIQLARLDIFGQVIGDSISIAIVSFAM